MLRRRWRVTPDMARIVGELGAEDGSRGVLKTLRVTGLMPPCRAFIAKRTTQMTPPSIRSGESCAESPRHLLVTGPPLALRSPPHSPTFVVANPRCATRLITRRTCRSEAAPPVRPQPNSVDYWADINGSALEVHRKDLYQCARWAPLMEKAYARFCQQYGQYDGAAPAGQGGSAAGTPGYDGINSGVANYALHVLYRAQADAAGATQYEWMTAFPSAGDNILAANPRAVDQLLQLAGRGETAAPGDATAPIITANTDPDLQINNLATAITNALGDRDYASLSAPSAPRCSGSSRTSATVGSSARSDSATARSSAMPLPPSCASPTRSTWRSSAPCSTRPGRRASRSMPRWRRGSRVIDSTLVAEDLEDLEHIARTGRDVSPIPMTGTRIFARSYKPTTPVPAALKIDRSAIADRSAIDARVAPIDAAAKMTPAMPPAALRESLMQALRP